MYIISWARMEGPRLYLCPTGDFVENKNQADKFDAKQAIDTQNALACKQVPRIVRIEPFATSLAEQLTPHLRDAVESLVGGNSRCIQFNVILRDTPALEGEWKASDAARAYAETLLRTLAK